jgi:ubiquinone/menaquinone biosynthesis C-methylase UbiE
MSRWSCYYVQIKKALSLKPKKILEIGPGDGIFGWYMEKNFVDYTSADHADDISSNVKVNLGFETLPFPDNSFDLVCAFQVLEHIPFEKVPFALSEIHRVTKKFVMFDIPQYGLHVQFLCKFPLLRRLAYHAVIPWPKEHKFDGFHYWEIGKKGYSPSLVRTEMKKRFSICDEFSILENPKERFYILEKR